MKKLFIVALAVLMATAAYAEDRLSLSGSMRVRAWDVNADTDANDWSRFDQRMRIGGTIAVSEGITGHFRFDLSEGTWGDNDFNPGGISTHGWARGSAAQDESIHVDRAYLQVDKELFKLRAGQFYNSFGTDVAVDYQGTGFALDLKCNPVTVSLAYAKREEGLGNNDDIAGFEDKDFYGVQVAYAAEKFGAKVYYAALADDQATEEEPWAVGVVGTAGLGTINLGTEIMFFGGDSATVDYEGTQAYVDVNCTAVENAKFGATLVWADAQDGAGETQATSIYAGGETFNPLGWSGTLLDYYYPVGSLYAGYSPAGNGGPFDPSGMDAGVVGGVLYAEYKLADVQLYAKVCYVEPEDESGVAGTLEDAVIFAGSVEYPVYKGFSVAGGYHYTSASIDSASDEDVHAFVGQMKISY
jgi:hypothetical protein